MGNTSGGFEPKAHWDLGEDLDIMTGNAGLKSLVLVSSLLQRTWALRTRYLQLHVGPEHGRKATEVITPYMVNHDSMFGTGQYRGFQEDTLNLAYQLRLIPTASSFDKLLPQ